MSLHCSHCAQLLREAHARSERYEEENEHLRRWKTEAMKVLSDWDACFDIIEAAGHSAPIGASKARYVAKFLREQQS